MTADWSRKLPTELALEVFEYLDVQSLCHLACVCRSWQRLAGQPSLWHEVCRRTQTSLDPDRSLHWKEKFKARVSSRKQLRGARRTRRNIVIFVCLLVCTSIALLASKQIYIQYRRLTRYDTVKGDIAQIDVVEHQTTHEDVEALSYEFVLQYRFQDRFGKEHRSWNLWPSPSTNDEFSTKNEALEAAYAIGRVGDEIVIYVNWDEHPPYMYLFRIAVFEPYFYLFVALVGLCVLAIADVISYSVLNVNPDTTDLKTFVPSMGSYMYPIADNRLDDVRVRRQQGLLLAIVAAVFHIVGILALCVYVHYSGEISFLWLFILIGEPIALYAAYQGFVHLMYCRFQPLLFCDRRPYLVLGSPNSLNVVFQTEAQFFARQTTIISTLIRADQETIVIPGEPSRTKIVYTVVHEQDVVCRNVANQCISPGQHYVDTIDIIFPPYLQASSPAEQVHFPKFIWTLTVRVCGNGPAFSKQLVIHVKE